MCEILAPAGDKNSAIAAVNADADAIYLGLKEYSARSFSENFDFENLDEIVTYCHSFGVKVYVAMNTLVKQGEVDGFIANAVSAWNIGVDAIIISDVFLGAFIKENYPEIVLHLSTQAGVCNRYGALFAKEKGFSRVILSRETAFEDIKEIAKIIETEVFVQGALCTCFSGQCYLSSFAGGNSGNRGKCKQPCRKKYSIDREGFEDNSYKLSLSDLSVGDDIKKFIEAGVFSYKIEGRMRRPEYVSAAVSYYRAILNGQDIKDGLSDLKRTYNRGNYTKGLAFGQDKSFISSAVQGHIGEFVGTVKVVNGQFICENRQNFSVGDGFKILRDGGEIGGATYGGKTKSGFILSTKTKLKNGDKVFITTDTAVNSRLLNKKRLIPVDIAAKFFVGKRAEVVINGVTFYGEKELEASKNRPLDAVGFENSFKKVDKFPFSVNIAFFETDGVFMASSELNALRRKVYSEYYLSISQNNNKKYEIFNSVPSVQCKNNDKTCVICTNLDGVSADIGILKLAHFNADIKEVTGNFKGEKYLYLPPYLTGNEIQSLKRILGNFDGIYCEGIYGFKLAEEVKMPLFVGLGLNISNSLGVLGCKSKYFALSKELTASESKSLVTDNAFYLTCGDIKVMDLIYCPFGKKCKTCDMRDSYTLTDENGRKFPFRRYKTSECRFEVFNCANLVSEPFGAGIMVDCTLENAEKVLKICKDSEKLKLYFKNYTKGHSVAPVN